MIPKNKHGQLDEWSALIQLQHQSADKRESQKKVEEKNKKQAYLRELQTNMEMKKKVQDQLTLQKQHDAALRLEEQRKIEADDKIAAERQNKKKFELIEMNKK